MTGRESDRVRIDTHTTGAHVTGTQGTGNWSRALLLLGALLAQGQLCPGLGAQGMVERERWSYAGLEALRRTLADECQGADADAHAAVARELVTPTQGNPYGPPLRALARLRGVEADPAFVYRGNLRAFASPEVVDPDGDVEVCRDLNVTFYLPYPVEDPTGEGGEVRFQVTVRNEAGDEVWETTVDDKTLVDDLLRYRPVCIVPGASLPDGSYTLTTRAYIDGEAPRRADLVTENHFAVLRGYQERARAIIYEDLPAFVEDDELPALSRAIVRGAIMQVARVYTAQAAAGRSRPLVELERAERVVENLRQGRAPLSGLTGRADFAVPTGHEDEIAYVSMMLPGEDEDPKPLVLFVPGGPAFDHGSARPASPTMTSPGWWTDLLIDRGFGQPERQWNWVVMESPGRLYSSLAALQGVVSALSELLEVPDGQVCIVAERQGAWVASHSLNSTEPDVAGLVLMVSGANLPVPKLEARDLHVLGIPAFGPVSSAGLERLGTRSATDRLRILDATSRPWPIVLSVSLPEIEAFLDRLRW